jgi:hypothetical protein
MRGRLHEERVRIDRPYRPLTLYDDCGVVVVRAPDSPRRAGRMTHDERGRIHPRKPTRRKNCRMLTEIGGLCQQSARGKKRKKEKRSGAYLGAHDCSTLPFLGRPWMSFRISTSSATTRAAPQKRVGAERTKTWQTRNAPSGQATWG